jgi:hypothetical protein
MKELAGFTNLQTLSLYYSQVTGEGLAALAALKNLHELSLPLDGLSGPRLIVLSRTGRKGCRFSPHFDLAPKLPGPSARTLKLGKPGWRPWSGSADWFGKNNPRCRAGISI